MPPLPDEVVQYLRKKAVTDGDAASILAEHAPAQIPKLLEFKHFLHDDREESPVYEILIKAGIDPEQVPFDVLRNLEYNFGEPFYEVELTCEWNTETGQVAVLNVAGVD